MVPFVDKSDPRGYPVCPTVMVSLGCDKLRAGEGVATFTLGTKDQSGPLAFLFPHKKRRERNFRAIPSSVRKS